MRLTLMAPDGQKLTFPLSQDASSPSPSSSSSSSPSFNARCSDAKHCWLELMKQDQKARESMESMESCNQEISPSFIPPQPMTLVASSLNTPIGLRIDKNISFAETENLNHQLQTPCLQSAWNPALETPFLVQARLNSLSCSHPLQQSLSQNVVDTNSASFPGFTQGAIELLQAENADDASFWWENLEEEDIYWALGSQFASKQQSSIANAPGIGKIAGNVGTIISHGGGGDNDDDNDRNPFQEQTKTAYASIHSSEPQFPSIASKMPELSASIGFATAGGKTVNIDYKSLAKAKKIFDDVDIAGINEVAVSTSAVPMSTSSKVALSTPMRDLKSMNVEGGGFSTASRKKVSCSDASLKRGRLLFADMNNHADEVKDANNSLFEPFTAFASASGKKMKGPSEAALKKAAGLFSDEGIATLAHDSDETKSNMTPNKFALDEITKMFKSNDDIVSFSSAKGSKIAMPSAASIKSASKIFGADCKSANIMTTPCPPSKKPTGVMQKPLMNSTVKKTPKYKFMSQQRQTPGTTVRKNLVKPVSLFNMSQIRPRHLRPSLDQYFKFSDLPRREERKTDLIVHYHQAAKYQFPNGWGYTQAYQDLLSRGAKPTSISLEWTMNHYKLIIWKQSNYSSLYPLLFELTPSSVLHELTYRYEIEVICGKRSVLRQIIEKDDTPNRYLILMVTQIYHISSTKEIQLELSDGWYTIRARGDKAMSQINKYLFVGMKLKIFGASLISNSGDGLGILEYLEGKSAHPELQISTNSIKKARWDEQLGRNRHYYSFLVSLYDVFQDGGLIPAVDVVIQRVFPLLILEKYEEGGEQKKVVRTVDEESKRQTELQTKMQEQIEQLVAKNLPNLEEEIELLSDDLRNRNTTPFLKIQICDSGAYAPNKRSGLRYGLLTIWRPDESLIGKLVVGKRLVCYGLKAVENYGFSFLSLSTTNSTRIEFK